MKGDILMSRRTLVLLVSALFTALIVASGYDAR